MSNQKIEFAVYSNFCFGHFFVGLKICWSKYSSSTKNFVTFVRHCFVRYGSFPKQLVESADLYKPVFNKTMK